MPSFAEVRQKYPQYSDMSDDDLADALHRKFYADMPTAEFRSKIGLGLGGGATADWGHGVSGGWESPQLAAMSNLERFRGGAKVAAQGVGMGLKQIGGNVTPEQVDAFRKQNEELLADPWGGSGATSANVVMATAPALLPGAGTILGSAATGALYGAAQPVGTGESRVNNALVGGAVSGGVTTGMKAIGRVIQPVRNANNMDEQAAVNLLRRNGVQLSVAGQTGSKQALGVQRMLGNNPYTAPAMAEKATASGRTLTRAFVRTAGINADKLTPDIAAAADTRIGAGMNSINAKYRLDMNDPQILQRLTNVDDEAKRILGAAGDNRIEVQVKQILGAAAQTGRIEAKAAQKLRIELGKLVGDPKAGEYAYQLREILDEALQKAARGTDDYARLVNLRSQYRNLQALVDSADTTANGQVSGARLASALNHSKYTKNSFRYGTGDTKLSELARAASTLADRFPNSGTAYHAAAQLAIPGIVGTGSYLADKDPEKALKLAAATYGLPKAAAFALTNPAVANYLAKGVPLPPVTNSLLKYAGRALAPTETALVLGQ